MPISPQGVIDREGKRSGNRAMTFSPRIVQETEST